MSKPLHPSRMTLAGLLGILALLPGMAMAEAQPASSYRAPRSGLMAAPPSLRPATTPGRSPVPPTVPPTTPTRPTDPLRTPSAPVAHPDKVLIESMALAGRRLVGGGLNGLLILSDDNGVSWRQVQIPIAATLTAIRFTDERTGWAVGHFGAVLRTDDAGEHWTLVYDGARAAQATLDAARIANQADSQRDVLVAAAQHLAQTNPSRPFLLIQAVGIETIRLIGAGNMSVESLDGGRHWLAWSGGIDNPDRLKLNGMADRNGFVVAAGERGLLLAGKPADGLHAMKSPYDGTFFGVLDGGRYGFVLFGQQGQAFASNEPGPDVAAGRYIAWHRLDNPSPTALTAGVLRQDGRVLLGDASGATWRLEGKPDDPRLAAAGAQATFPILALAEAADGSLILAGSGGVLRVPPDATIAKTP